MPREDQEPEPMEPSGESDTGDDEEQEEEQGVDPIGSVSYQRHLSAVAPKYKIRTLVFATRGINPRERHLLLDLRNLLPHHKPESKLDEKRALQSAVTELCQAKKCDSAILLENRKRRDLYLWVSMAPTGPSVRFHVLNVHTTGELKLTGNCIKGSRPILHFDKVFDDLRHLRVIKALLCHTFGTPRFHALSRPFVDHMFCFFYFDSKIYFRNYQIVEQEATKREIDRSLLEIGPRFVLDPIRVFYGCMGGRTIWKNPGYISPSQLRSVAIRGRRKKQKQHPQSDKPKQGKRKAIKQ
jgi:ribosome biogenesis protein BRX1